MMLRNAKSDQSQTHEKKLLALQSDLEASQSQLKALQNKFDALQDQVEANLLCPITCEIMAEPVVASDGYTYECEAIEQIINTTKISPINRTHQLSTALCPNHSKKSDISSYLSTHPELYMENSRVGVYLPAVWIKKLFMAICENNIDQVKLLLARDPRLLEHSFSPKITKLSQPYTTIQLACEQGSPEIIKYILQLLQSKNGLTRLASIPIRFNPRYLNILLQQSLETETDPEFLTLLLILGANIEQQEIMSKNTLLHQFARAGNIGSVRWLLAHGAALERQNVSGKAALELAEENGHWGLAKLLLLMGAKQQIHKPRPEFNAYRMWGISIGFRLYGTTAFLQYVVNGEQEQAAEMLKANPSLVLMRGNVTDHAGRVFKDITGFQYAIWALDWDMWRMIKAYLPDGAARMQLEKFIDSTWEVTKTHGYYFKIHPLLNVLETYIGAFQYWNPEQQKYYWINIVGNAQKKLPMHMLQQYCNRQRPFGLPPIFDSSTEVMSRKLDVDLSVLGVTRAMSFGGKFWLYGDLEQTKYDMRVLELLSVTRLNQLEELRASLIPVSRSTVLGSSIMRRSRTAL